MERITYETLGPPAIPTPPWPEATAATMHGPVVTETGTTFRVWAPGHRVELALYDESARPERVSLRERRPMRSLDGGFHALKVPEAREGALYAFYVEGEGPFPDPASRAQPFGVHGPSRVVDTARLRPRPFPGRALDELILYELHVGTATPEGTFLALAERLDAIAELGVTAIEVMPIADFPGRRNWGYDGVAPFAPARCYGTPEDLAALVDAAHARGLAVILDVVYNHLGPDGNYLRAFSPYYFTDRACTPWGDAIDFATPASAPVRAFVIENALQWVIDYGVDGLRLDATHAIFDPTTPHILSELAETVRAAAGDRHVVVIAEDERNEARLVTPRSEGGLGLSAVWADDFHHEVRRILAGDHEGWFEDFRGDLDELVELLRDGWLYQGQRSRVRGGPRGTPIAQIPPERLVYCLQNHDQVGNRARGERLHHDVDLASVRAATVLLFALPYTPMLFAGQEWAARTKWPYFTDHDQELGARVAAGRRQELAAFRAFAEREIPDPQDVATFEAAKLDWSETTRSPGREVRALHRALIALRRDEPAMRNRLRASFQVARRGNALVVERRPLDARDRSLTFVIALTGGCDVEVGRAEIVLDSEAIGGGLAAIVEDDRLVFRSAGGVVLGSVAPA
ncbi:MAG: malto-oligosyltrehalose trehalohydrolase [Deltaproteobacteria bacterium]|nr:malto-oligosyltrehalose trehalohydrolase [Deltaproteobacteria bacterium]